MNQNLGAFFWERNLCLHPVFKDTTGGADAQKRSEVGLPEEGVIVPRRLTLPEAKRVGFLFSEDEDLIVKVFGHYSVPHNRIISAEGYFTANWRGGEHQAPRCPARGGRGNQRRTGYSKVPLEMG